MGRVHKAVAVGQGEGGKALNVNLLAVYKEITNRQDISPDAMTVAEVARKLNVNPRCARTFIDKALRAGRARLVGLKWTPNAVGRVVSARAFVFDALKSKG